MTAARLAGALLALWMAAAAAGAATPHLDLEVRLDPASRAFSAKALLSGAEGLRGIELSPLLAVTRLEADGRALPLPGAGRIDLERPARTLRLAYEGQLAPLAEADHRQVLERLPPMAAPEGSYLPAGGGWYPEPGRPFTYRLRLTLPPGQKGVAPGRLVWEQEGEAGYSAEFGFPHPGEGIDLMAGPYRVSERRLTLPQGRSVRIRAWFHPDLDGLADGYLADSARYLERYSRLIGPYPFTDFSIVSSPLPTGFGMPSLTYLGRDVLRLPFIRATSLGHEVLHNWWGNGVYPDWATGNWSEGLTTFLADYAYKEDESAEAARAMRLGWLRDLAAVPEAEDGALAGFTSRRHGISSIVGYDKAAMFFFMLRERIGHEAFTAGLRRLWAGWRFRAASWADLEKVFGEASGQDLSRFFRHATGRPGSPRVALAGAEQDGGTLTLDLRRSGAWTPRLPLRLHRPGGGHEDRWVDLPEEGDSLRLAVAGPVEAVSLDPDYRVWRRLDPAQLPAILREVFVAPRVGVTVADADPAVAEAARFLAGRLLDVPPERLAGAEEGLPGAGAGLVLGTEEAVAAWLDRHGLPHRPEALAGVGSARVWAARDRDGRPYAVVSARDADALRALERGLPHYGRQSWLLFAGPRVADKGIWPAGAERVAVRAAGHAPEPGLTPPGP